jgi:hypothetical protein
MTEAERKAQHDRERDAEAERGARLVGGLDVEGRVKRAIRYARYYEAEVVPERERYEAQQAEQRRLRGVRA